MVDELIFERRELVGIATRTLLAAGYEITNCQRHPQYAEIYAEVLSRLGAVVRFMIALTDELDFTTEQQADVRREAEAHGRAAVFVARRSAEHQSSWEEFLEAMGGAVPSWRALSPIYETALCKAARNELPTGTTGEPWRIFEELVADGLEFVFGRRVRRLGGRKRGQTVSDMLAQMPDGGLEVVDAKAAGAGFDADWAAVRALAEYVGRQKQRQTGHNVVFGSLLVSSAFKQGVPELVALSQRFLAETGVPLAFLTSTTLAAIVDRLRQAPHLRNAIRWRTLVAGGLVEIRSVEREMKAACDERYERSDV